MKLQFIWVGKTRKAAVKELADEYMARVNKFARVEVIEVRDRDGAGSDRDRILEKEADDLLSRIEAGARLVVLDEKGSEFDSFQLADLLRQEQNAGTKQITFVIGGHYGLADRVKKRADLLLALSRLTLPHELARLFLLEQVYRAFAILHGLPYQK
jgi:23S rRNA (pseudouridine1915-N3)-methyltransferase